MEGGGSAERAMSGGNLVKLKATAGIWAYLLQCILSTEEPRSDLGLKWITQQRQTQAAQLGGHQNNPTER